MALAEQIQQSVKNLQLDRLYAIMLKSEFLIEAYNENIAIFHHIIRNDVKYADKFNELILNRMNKNHFPVK